MSLFGGVLSLQGIVLLLLSIVAFGICVYALVDALRQKSAGFTAAGKLTKPIWLGILGFAAAIAFLCLGSVRALGFLNVISVVAAGVYLADVRPAVRGYSGRGGGNAGPSGPYGPW
jgi:hypothetical protein